MCVIAYKAREVRLPEEGTIRKMWEANPDGAGVMWRDDDGLVHWKKGFMSLKKLNRWIKLNRAWLSDVECALHFRITTHGGTSPGNCHPFAIDGGDPHRLEGSARSVMMHNGMLPIKTRDKDISDSAELALRLSRYADHCDILGEFDDFLNGNRIIVFGEDGTHFYGDAFVKRSEDDGILYSNTRFEFTSCLYGGNAPVGFYKEADPWYVDGFHASGSYDNSKDTGFYENYDKMYEMMDKYGIDEYEFYDCEREAEYTGMDVEDYIRANYAVSEEYETA